MPQDSKKLIDVIPKDAIPALGKTVENAFSSVPVGFLSNPGEKDPDGAYLYSALGAMGGMPTANLMTLRDLCWEKFFTNPAVNTAVEAAVGRLIGQGFRQNSHVFEINEFMTLITRDYRNRLTQNIRAWVTRAVVENELHLTLTLHKNGFVEVDFTDPLAINTWGNDGSGIIYHPRKHLPLFSFVRQNPDRNIPRSIQPPEFEIIPSVFIARDPSLQNAVAGHHHLQPAWSAPSKAYGYSSTGGYFRFMVSWIRGPVVKRATASLLTILRWAEIYEMLKNYEVDHKRGLGAYSYVFSPESQQSWDRFWSLTPEQREQTALLQPATPGQKILLPPGWEGKVLSPQLPSLSGQDTDILDMLSSGLDETTDVMTGRSSGTYASSMSARGPMTDRASNQAAYFERFWKLDFWSSVFFLASTRGALKPAYEKLVPVGYENGQLVSKKVLRAPEDFVNVSFPVSQSFNLKERAEAVFGAKHASLVEGAGVPYQVCGEMLGIGDMRYQRMMGDLERQHYPPLPMALDQEAIQETLQAEPGRKRQQEVARRAAEEGAGEGSKEPNAEA